MKPATLLKRNVFVALALVVILTGFRIVAVGFTPRWLLIAIVFCSFLWANWPLNSRSHPIWAILLSLLLVPAVGFPAGVASILIGRRLVEWEYRAQGFQMVDGCNAAAANMADFDSFAIRQRLDEIAKSPSIDTNQTLQLQSAYAVAQGKAKFLSDDCARRGHCDNHPWKTNWISIKEAVAASE